MHNQFTLTWNTSKGGILNYEQPTHTFIGNKDAVLRLRYELTQMLNYQHVTVRNMLGEVMEPKQGSDWLDLSNMTAKCLLKPKSFTPVIMAKNNLSTTVTCPNIVVELESYGWVVTGEDNV